MSPFQVRQIAWSLEFSLNAVPRLSVQSNRTLGSVVILVQKSHVDRRERITVGMRRGARVVVRFSSFGWSVSRLWSRRCASHDFYWNDFDDDFLTIGAEGEHRMSESLQLLALQGGGVVSMWRPPARRPPRQTGRRPTEPASSSRRSWTRGHSPPPASRSRGDCGSTRLLPDTDY